MVYYRVFQVLIKYDNSLISTINNITFNGLKNELDKKINCHYRCEFQNLSPQNNIINQIKIISMNNYDENDIHLGEGWNCGLSEIRVVNNYQL